MKRFFSLFCSCALMLITALPASAAGYPEKPIQLLVPWGAGGDSDASMRIFASFLTEELGQPVAVVNVPGAGGNLGNRQGKDAAPDGYTLTMIHESVLTSALVGMVDFTYEDFTPIANVCHSPMYLASRPDAPWNTAQEMVAYAKENPGKVTFAATLGSSSHFFPLDVAYAGKVDIKVIAYEGTAKRMQGLMGGFVDLGEANPGTASDLFASGKLKMLGSASAERNELTPDTPTLTEQGLPVLQAVTRSIFAPKGTPEDVVARLEEAIKNVCANPEFMEKIHDSGSVSYFMDRQALTTFLSETAAHMKTLAEAFNILAKK